MKWFARLIALWLLPCPGKKTGWVKDLVQENLALHQQNAVLHRRARKVRLQAPDRMCWAMLSRIWPQWREACMVVKPATVIHWHQTGFRLFWRWKCRQKRKAGRPSISGDLRVLMQRMARESPLWGAPRIHGALLRLGFHLSERSVQRWMPRRITDPRRTQTWEVFRNNHREMFAAMDFLVVPTWDFGLIYVMVILHHGRRMVLHLNVTQNPTAELVRQQLREAFPFDEIPRYLIFDRDTIFGSLRTFIQSLGITPKQTNFRSPWQNGACERFIGTLRRELLDHVIVLNEQHLMRLLKGYLSYYHKDRTHLVLEKGRPFQGRDSPIHKGRTNVVALPQCGGLHHRYARRTVA